MKALFPTSKRKPKSRDNPYAKSSIISKLLFSWMSELIQVSSKVTWLQEFNYHLREEEKAKYHKEKMEEIFRRKKKLIPTIVICFKNQLIIFTLMNLISNTLMFLITTTTSAFLKVLTEEKDLKKFENMKPLIFYLVIGGILRTFTTLIKSYFKYYAERISLSLKATILSMLQDKIVKFSTMNSSKLSEGLITNLVQVDAEVTAQLMTNIYGLIYSIIGIGVASVGISYYVDWKVAGVVMGTYISVNMLNFLVFYFKNIVIGNYLKAKDKRMTLFRNILENIDYIKVKALENLYIRDLYESREHELGYLKQDAAVDGILMMITFLSFTMTNTAMMIYFCFFVGQTSYPFSSFSGISENLLHVKKYFVNFFANWKFFVTFKASADRLDLFLNSKEIDQSHVLNIGKNISDTAVVVKNGYFKWRYTKEEEENKITVNKKKIKESGSTLPKIISLQSRPSTHNSMSTITKDNDGSLPFLEKEDEEENLKILEPDGRNFFYLRNINFSVQKGSKVAVIGKSCSGKSSLLYSLLGEMIPLDNYGRVEVMTSGDIAYMSQQRWIIGDTIRENITLGKDYDEHLMEKSLEASQLFVDLLLMDDGLDTVISDSGDTVSGGQRARIALARCFYQK